MILAPLQKLPKNVGDLGKLIVAKGFKKSPKVQKIANSGHTDPKGPLELVHVGPSVVEFPSKTINLHLQMQFKTPLIRMLSGFLFSVSHKIN